MLCIASGHYMLPNVFYATLGAGGVFSASSPASTPAELAGQMRQVDCKLLFCNEDTKEVAREAARLAKFPLSRVFLLGPGPEFELSDLERGSPAPISSRMLDWDRITDPEKLDNSVVCILFSSGTTGQPKGVKLSHSNLVAEASLVLDPIKAYNALHNPDHGVRTLAHLPAAHIAGVQGYFVNGVYMGGTVYWMRRFDFVRFLEYSKKYRVTNLFSVPPIFLLIAKSPLMTDQFESIDMIISGAAPLGKELQLAAEKKLGKGKILAQTYGLSETTGSITAMPKGVRDETGSVAYLLSNCMARIVDDDGKDVEPGQAGEIWFKGPVVTKGYYKNEEANRGSFVDGWFCTGDIGLFRDGKFYIVDRKKVRYPSTLSVRGLLLM